MAKTWTVNTIEEAAAMLQSVNKERNDARSRLGAAVAAVSAAEKVVEQAEREYARVWKRFLELAPPPPSTERVAEGVVVTEPEAPAAPGPVSAPGEVLGVPVSVALAVTAIAP